MTEIDFGDVKLWLSHGHAGPKGGGVGVGDCSYFQSERQRSLEYIWEGAEQVRVLIGTHFSTHRGVCRRRAKAAKHLGWIPHGVQ